MDPLKIKINIPLASYTSFKIGGKARYFLMAHNKEDLVKAISFAKNRKIRFLILGNASNVLISDNGYRGLVIKIKNNESRIKDLKRGLVYFEAAVLLNQAVNLALKNGLTGLEWAMGIPGTIGGAVRGNAGAFGGSMKDIVIEVEVMDTKDFKIKKIKNKNCKFGYRESIFKKNKNLIILSAVVKLKKENKNKIKTKIKEYLEKRNKSQPLNYPSAGSVFKNPKGFSAGELIEKCGLKGRTIGRARISEKHANFIVNLGEAKASDVKKLINLAKKEVKKKFGIVLKEEIQVF